MSSEGIIDLLSQGNYHETIKMFHKIQPFYYDENNILWMWDKTKSIWKTCDIKNIILAFSKVIPKNYNVVNSKIYGELSKSIYLVGLDNVPKPAKLKWIQFNKKAYSIGSGKTYDVTPDYFFTNCIPWDLGETSDTPMLDKYFKDWVGEEYVQTLYELIAYCCYGEYRIQLLFFLFGNGTNGKSTFMKILRKFLGKYNCCTTSLEALSGNNERFETYRLYKKLYCEIGEANKGVLSKTSLIKKITGDDMMSYEKKNCTPFSDFNYAKIIIASNSIPITQDETDGFYRRCSIIKFPNQFTNKINIMNTIPDKEYCNLAKRCMEILPKLIKNGYFTNEGTIEDKRMEYNSCSNPLMQFINERCDKSMLETDVSNETDKYYVLYQDFFNEYGIYLKKLGIKKNFNSSDFKSSLNNFGILATKCHRKIKGNERYYGYFILGYKFKGKQK